MNPSIFAESVTLPKAMVAPDNFQPFEWAWLDESIPACFARRVAAHPQVIAVHTADASLSYEQLGRMANRLANALLERLGHEIEPVAILTGSDVNAVAAMMGILTSGKFFVAINPDSSPHEMQAILTDSGARAIVTDRHSAATASSLATVEQIGRPLFQVDRLNVDIPEAAPTVPITGATFAQIAYTSGSTGTPKGILKTHRALLHQSMTHINGYFITPTDRMMAPAPLIFGASLGIVFSALLGGASLLPIRLKDCTAAHLRDWLRDERVTVYHSVASFFRQFAATLDRADAFPGLRIIKLGGEAIQPEDIRLYRQGFADDCVLRIGLASTEAGNYCWHFVGKETALEGPTVPVGRPLVGTEVLLLDEQREPVAHGEIGEIAVRSAYLASGYWRNLDLTHARFLPDPTDSQKTVYVTGDLGRWRDNGLLEHLGRADQMVKIRGNRVEIGAVEAALLALPAISAAAVVAVEGAGGTRHLRAYLTPVAERMSVSELRAQLRASLPDYMLPARLVWIDRMPRLPSGKVDRNALPLPDKARPDLDTPFVAPRNELEQQIADIWAELLELDEVGVEDNFFELGGDSLMALRMALIIEQRFQQQLPADYFRAATISVLAMTLQGELNATRAPHSAKTLAQRVPHNDSAKTLAQVDAPSAQLPRRFHRKVPMNGALRRATLELALRLPYQQGLRWLIWWSKQAFVQNTLYGAQQRQFHRLLMDLGHPNASAQRSFQANLFGNLIQVGLRRWRMQDAAIGSDLLSEMTASRYRFWRTLGEQCRQSPEAKHNDLIVYTGLQHFREAQAQGCGIILLTYHTPAGAVFKSIFTQELNLAPILTLSQASTAGWVRKKATKVSEMPEPHSPTRSTHMGMQGLYQLRAGGIVQIVNDMGYAPINGLPQSIIGRRYSIKPGFAELAMATDAIVLPIYHLYEADGWMRTVFLPPIEPPDKEKDRHTQLREWVGKYALFLEMAWRTAPESLHWATLRHHVTQPMILETRRDDQ